MLEASQHNVNDMKTIIINFPDGSEKEFPVGITGFEIAQSISNSLAKKAIVVKIDGELKDLHLSINGNCCIEILASSSDPEILELLRHDCAHVMAEAVKELFPETQVTIGPAIENGFYYDFAREKPFTTDDLEIIEKKMHEIVNRNEKIVREVWDRDEAIKFFKGQGEEYKAEIIGDIPSGEQISLYRQGDFIDLCRGPHLPSTGKLGKAFKLMKVSGAYWRGDHNNPMLQRIYGTAWSTEKELKSYLNMLVEAEKRDHRRLGKDLQLFHLQEEAAGSIFWHKKGWTIYRIIETFIRDKLEKADYEEVKTPQILNKLFWEKSGHWDKFRENMFVVEHEDPQIALKPMSCPSHIQIFKQGIKSYRDLPLRMAEFGCCFRNEPSGALHGIMRVRSFTQDDAHIFCTEDQIVSETKTFCDLLISIYKDFGFEKVKVLFSDRPELRAGSNEVWDKAESALKEAVEATNLEYSLNPGEGAFYGPKLEFILEDALGREWQCGTLQVDFVLPERLDASYIDEKGEKQRPVMLHRAILGSFERFIGILIEHYAGKFPLWLSPVQVVVANITDESKTYAENIFNKLTKNGIRCEIDLRNEKIGYKIREHSHAKIPYIFVVGAKEAANNTVAIRQLGSKDQTIVEIDKALNILQDKVKNKEIS